MEQSELEDIGKKGIWDYIGVVISGLCLVHCMLVPLVLITFPAIGSYLMDEGSLFHQLLFLAIVFVASIAFYFGFRIHHSREPIVWMVIGLILVTAGMLLHDRVDHFWATTVVMAGSVCLIRAHLINHSKRHLSEQQTSCKTCQKN